MTPELAFRARELSASGIWSGRIAALLDVDERLVLRALNGGDFEERPVEPPDEPPRRAPRSKPADPNAWPPPVDDSTEWEEVAIRVGYGAPPRRVRVRWVRLWGQRVRINDADEVWCHACRSFKTTSELSHPWNRCPVGLPYRGGIIAVDFDEPEPPEAMASTYRARFVDFLRVPM